MFFSICYLLMIVAIVMCTGELRVLTQRSKTFRRCSVVFSMLVAMFY